MVTGEPILVPEAVTHKSRTPGVIVFRKASPTALKCGEAERKEEPQRLTKGQIEEVRRSQLTAEEREQERRELRRSVESGIERDSPINSIHVPKDHHIFDLSIINVKAKRWRHYTDIIARTKDEALLEAIRRFDQTWPHTRAKRWPIRVCFRSIDRKETNLWQGESVSWKWAFPPVAKDSLWDVTCTHPKLGRVSSFRVRADSPKNAASKARQMFAGELQCVTTEIEGRHRRTALKRQAR